MVKRRSSHRWWACSRRSSYKPVSKEPSEQNERKRLESPSLLECQSLAWHDIIDGANERTSDDGEGQPDILEHVKQGLLEAGLINHDFNFVGRDGGG